MEDEVVGLRLPLALHWGIISIVIQCTLTWTTGNGVLHIIGIDVMKYGLGAISVHRA